MAKVLVVITTGFVSWGGLTTVAMNYYQVMDKTGFLINFASINEIEKPLLTILKQNNSRYIQLPDRKLNLLGYMRALYEEIKVEKYDIIHIHGNSATMAIELFLAYLIGVKTRIGHVHTSRPQHFILNVMLKPFMQRLITQRVAVSEEAGKNLFGDRKFLILNNAIDVNHYRFNKKDRDTFRKRMHISENDFVIGNVGKINAGKNQKFLVEIFAAICKTKENAKLLIVGDGELKEELLLKIHALGIEGRCILAGMQMDTAPFLSVMDVFVFPSFYEGLSLSLLEAQASGLKCYYTETLARRGIVAPYCYGLGLDKKSDWINAISNVKEYDREKTSERAIECLTECGFNINNESNHLKELYL